MSVYTEKNETSSDKTVSLPAVYRAPIRPDIVSVIHHEIAKNSRQAYSVNKDSGHQVKFIKGGRGKK